VNSNVSVFHARKTEGAKTGEQKEIRAHGDRGRIQRALQAMAEMCSDDVVERLPKDI